LRIVADTGADAVTHRRVAEVAQLPLASTTYYFASKEELLTAALELAAERDLFRLQAIAFTVRPAVGSLWSAWSAWSAWSGVLVVPRSR
jgi:TetR/AcrR family transcriptional regulator, regulator of biofilm formation and stress response